MPAPHIRTAGTLAAFPIPVRGKMLVRRVRRRNKRIY